MKRTAHNRFEYFVIGAIVNLTGFLMILLAIQTEQANASSIDRFSELINPNIVKIMTQFSDGSDERGFGFVMLERNNTLYIATAKHVVNSDDPDIATDIIKISFYNIQGSQPAEVIHQHERYDIALLKTKKPLSYIWASGNLSRNVDRNDRVWFIGRNWDWDNITEDFAGKVSRVRGIEIEADMSGVTVGSSGGPLMASGGIAGMIIGGSGNRVVALKIGYIQELIVDDWLKLQQVKDIEADVFPYVSIGALGGLPVSVTTQEPEDISVPRSYGAYLDIAMSPKYSVRISHEKAKLKRKDSWPFTGESIALTAVTLHLYKESPIFNRYFLPSQYLLLSYGFGEIKPELNVNRSQWLELRDISKFEDSYSDDFHALTVGYGMESAHSNALHIGIEFGVTYTTTKYLDIDLSNPFEAADTDDWLIFFRINVGYAFKRREPSIKLLR
jgi:hypothetical protein